MLRKKKLPSYNDGIVEIYRDDAGRTSFEGKRNPYTLDDLEPVVTLAFYECSMREQDHEAAERKGFTLTRKVRTHSLDSVEPGQVAVIGHLMYRIKSLDPHGREMYIYMEGGRKIER